MARQPQELSQDLVFRGYRSRDLDTLFAIDVACFPEPFRFSRELLRRFVEKRGALTVVAEISSVIAGFVVVHLQRTRTGTLGYVVTLDVLEPYRRAGVGAHLMREGERLAQDRGAMAMQLHVFADNQGARSFYERLGYAERGTAEHFYGEALHALVLEKPLPAPAVGA